MTRIRKLTGQGTQAFREYWREVRAGAPTPPPLHLLEDPATSESLDVTISVEPRHFGNRLEAAKYLRGLLAPLPKASVEHDAGLWNWLSLFYFDALCPSRGSRGRKVKQIYHYILPSIAESGHSWHYYRHLLAGPYRIYKLHGEQARILLCGELSEFGDLNEQLASRQEFITNPGIIQAVDLLYYDEGQGKPKRGSSPNSRKPGTLRRFIDVIQQFDLTYDVYSLAGKQLIDLLPSEFDRWKKNLQRPSI